MIMTAGLVAGQFVLYGGIKDGMSLFFFYFLFADSEVLFSRENSDGGTPRAGDT